MEALSIKTYPNGILREKCAHVESITKKERSLFEKMLFTMRYFCGIGLAAPQIGISKRLIVAEIEGKVIKLANPVIIKTKGVNKMIEGCLSIPDIAVDIERVYEVIVKGLNDKGENIEIKADGLLARVLQHEIDHLKGRLIIDYMSVLEKLKFKLRNKED